MADFYIGAFGTTTGHTSEIADWTETLQAAQSQGLNALLGAAQNMGNSVFTSSAYTNLSTDNTQYVTDLYQSYLQRNPDDPPDNNMDGRNFWVDQLTLYGNTRTGVRQAFAVCTEFTDEKIATLCPCTSTTTSTSAHLKYVLTDAQGSTRVLMENNGTSSAILARHDYLPFGEEIWAGVGSRSTSQKYATTTGVRQRFALTERDEASGLDHTWFRKYDSFAGRWTSPDPYGGSIGDPQSFNRYAYVGNNPINLSDPLGLDGDCAGEFNSSGGLYGGGRCTIGPDGSGGAGGVGGIIGDTGIVIATGGDFGGESPGHGGGGDAHPQNTGHEFAHSRPSPCPPTGEQLAANKIIRDAIHETSKKADQFRDTHGYWIEHGGWIFANLKTGKVATYIKNPATSPPFAKDYPYLDGAVKVYLNDPPPPPKGWEIVGKFHVHPDDGWNPETDGAAADQNKVPGLVGTPNGTIYVGGSYKRGIWNSDLPSRCR